MAIIDSIPCSYPAGAKITSGRNRACDGCRTRKVCCIIKDTPPCYLCATYGKECTFNILPKKRKKVVHIHQRPAHNDSIQTSSQQTLQVTGKSLSVEEWVADDVGLELFASPDCQQSSQPVEAEERQQRAVMTLMDEPVDIVGPARVSLFEYMEFDHSGECSFGGQRIRRIADGNQFLYFSTKSNSEAKSRLHMELYKIISPNIAARLVDLFWFNLYVYLPIISKSLYLGVTAAELDAINPYFLAAICHLSMDFWSLDEELCVQLPERDLSERLYGWALAQFYGNLHAPEFATFQTALCLLQSRRETSVAFQWNLVSAVSAMAQTLGLNLDPTLWQLSPAEIRLRKRCWWSLQIHEKMLCVIVGQRSLIKEDEHDIPQIGASEFGVDANSKAISQHFIEMARFAMLLDKIEVRLHSLQAYDDITHKLQLIRKLQIELRTWYAELPPAIQLAEYVIPYHQPNGNPSLHLAYYLAEVNILQVALHLGLLDNSLRSEAVVLSKKIVSFVCDFKPRHCQAFWHSWSRPAFTATGNFMMELLASANNIQEAKQARNIIDQWRSVLSWQSRVFDKLNMAMLAVDTVYHNGFTRTFNVIENGLSTDKIVELKSRKGLFRYNGPT